jgi:UDP-2,4-diacetamido-2,4,6-trideoxy-beta-L-altropyranose hydrolase
VILDQNFYEEPSARYAGRVPAHCIYALGPQFALLRTEFFEARSHLVSRDGRLRRILVAMGGADKTNETGKVLEALCAASFTQFRIDVLLGTLNRHKEELLVRYAEMPHVHFHASDSNVAVLMASADLSIGGGGTMNWERCFMGLPSVVIVVAQNQLETNEALHRAGYVVNLGWHADVSASRIAAVVSQLADDPIAVQTLSRRSLALMSPSGSNESDLKILQLLIGAVNDRR